PVAGGVQVVINVLRGQARQPLGEVGLLPRREQLGPEPVPFGVLGDQQPRAFRAEPLQGTDSGGGVDDCRGSLDHREFSLSMASFSLCSESPVFCRPGSGAFTFSSVQKIAHRPPPLFSKRGCARTKSSSSRMSYRTTLPNLRYGGPFLSSRSRARCGTETPRYSAASRARSHRFGTLKEISSARLPSWAGMLDMRVSESDVAKIRSRPETMP